MSEKVSESDIGQFQPKPDREQRDDAFSTGAGRKATEVPVEEELSPEHHARRHELEEVQEAPVGTEMETKAHDCGSSCDCH